MAKRERPSVWVMKLDQDKASALMTQRAKDKGYDIKIEADPMVVVNTKKGIATICSEGVGWWKNDIGKYLLIGSYGYTENAYYVTADELKDLVSDELCYLDEFIRSFGDRLETNFDLWYNQVMGNSQQPHVIIQALMSEVDDKVLA